jgi:hypothetical protein
MDIIAKAARPLAREVHQERGAPLTVTMSINEAARENPSQRVSLQSTASSSARARGPTVPRMSPESSPARENTGDDSVDRGLSNPPVRGSSPFEGA